MKFLTEFRNPEMAKKVLVEIEKTAKHPWQIMEICGGQTHSLVKNGILSVLPENVKMLHGPGCPVCVTPLHLIDKAIYLAEHENVILCSFGDMLRVPGSQKSLLEAKAGGADIRILYSPLEAVSIAQKNPDREVVFFAVGFETTAPANALSVLQAYKTGVTNYSILTSHVLVPPAIQALLEDPEAKIDAFLAAGHVCSVMGYWQYHALAKRYKTPIVITGFEPLDLLLGILAAVKQLEKGEAFVENQYKRMVREAGNVEAQKIIDQVFEDADQDWRGIGTIPMSGWKLKEKYSGYDADKKFDIDITKVQENQECIAGDIMKGIKKPFQCVHFGKACTPQNPLGAPMVSSEGICAAYYNFSNMFGELKV
jgi:hydrogenase expression/formation protein HypD